VWGFGLDRAGSRYGHLAVNAIMNFRVPKNAGINLISCNSVSFARRTLFHGVSK
jgi:hypothetical protein